VELREIEQKLKNIGIYDFRDFDSYLDKSSNDMYLEFVIHFEEDLFGNDTQMFWDFYKNYCYDGNLDLILFEIPQGINLEFVYKNYELSVMNNNSISHTHFFKFLFEGLKYYLDEIMNAFINA